MNEPIHILSLGAGVQSSTLALMAAFGEVTPMPIAAIFADTQDEPQSVYTWLDWLEKQLPFPVYRVTAGQLSARALQFRTSAKKKVYTKTDIPFFTLSADGKKGMVTSRACTQDFKIAPLRRKQKELAGVRGKPRLTSPSPRVISWIGISADELYRMKQSRDWWAENRWPLVELGMTRRKCLQWMAAHKFPEPPRSSCVFCPFHNDAEWRRLKTHEPLAFERAVAFERANATAKAKTDNWKSQAFLHRSRVPLDQVDFSTEEERGQLNMFNNECEGMCGV